MYSYNSLAAERSGSKQLWCLPPPLGIFALVTKAAAAWPPAARPVRVSHLPAQQSMCPAHESGLSVELAGFSPLFSLLLAIFTSLPQKGCGSGEEISPNTEGCIQGTKYFPLWPTWALFWHLFPWCGFWSAVRVGWRHKDGGTGTGEEVAFILLGGRQYIMDALCSRSVL